MYEKSYLFPNESNSCNSCVQNIIGTPEKSLINGFLLIFVNCSNANF